MIRLGSGCGAVGRVAASNTRDPWFESQHRQLQLRKDENKEKEAGIGPLKKLFLCLSVLRRLQVFLLPPGEVERRTPGQRVRAGGRDSRLLHRGRRQDRPEREAEDQGRGAEVRLRQQRPGRLLLVGLPAREGGRDGEVSLPQDEVHLLLKRKRTKKIATGADLMKLDRFVNYVLSDLMSFFGCGIK